MSAVLHHQGEITESSETIQRRRTIVEKLSTQTRMWELDLLQDEIEEAKRLLEEAHVEVQAAQAKVTEAASRAGTAMDDMAELKSLIVTNSASSTHCRLDRGNLCLEESIRRQKCGQTGTRRYGRLKEP